MSDSVAAWLNGIGLGQYLSAFEEHEIQVHLLPDLTDGDLRELGVNALGHRKTMLKSIEALRQETVVSATPADDASSDEDITAWSRTPGERKPVTLLFADIVGSTALTEKLDPEEAHDLLYRATEKMCQAIDNNFCHRRTIRKVKERSAGKCCTIVVDFRRFVETRSRE